MAGNGVGGSGGERRRALHDERASSRRGAHAAPAQVEAAPLTAPVTGPLGPALPVAQLPSRRDRAALRRPSPLDEPAVLVGDTMAWKSFPALSEAPTRSALATAPAPLTRALARSITDHLAAPEAPMVPVFVPRGRSAPAVSGPLDVVAPSWTTGPVTTRRSLRDVDELPPPPSAAEVEAELRERERERTAAQTTGSSSVVVPTAALLALPGPAAPREPDPRPTSPLGADDLAAVRAAAAPARPSARAAATTASRTTGRSTGPATRHARSGSTRAPRRWHQRRALGVPVGLLAAAAALVVAVAVGTVSDGAQRLPELLTAATGGGSSSPSPAPARTTDPAPKVSASSPAGAGTGTADAAATGPAAAPAAAGTPAAETPAEQTAAASAAARSPAAQAAKAAAAPTASIPTGDVTYEGFGTAKNTYVELGTADSRETSTDLGATFSRTMTGSTGWPGWYVGVNSQDGEGTVGCRIKDADGRVLVEHQAEAGKTLALCILGSPLGATG